jgi:hypothetical protein
MKSIQEGLRSHSMLATPCGMHPGTIVLNVLTDDVAWHTSGMHQGYHGARL